MIQEMRLPTRIRFGEGAINEVPGHLKEAGKSRPLLVADKGISSLPMVTNLQEALQQAGLAVTVYDDFAGNPAERHVRAGVEAFHRHDADCLIIMGGGSTLDTGKAIGLMVRNPGDIRDYRIAFPPKAIEAEIPFILAIPTTAGTGSEVGGASVISGDDDGEKYIVSSEKMLPPLVIGDPALTYGLPPAMTAATGMDALTHCIEAFLTNRWHPICEGIALEGIRLIFKNVEKACAEPENTAARSAMLMAAMMGAISFQKGLGVIHSCAHALGSVHDLHHGTAIAAMLPAGLEFNRQGQEKKYRRILEAAGHPADADLPQVVRDLIGRILPDLQLRESIPEISEPLLAAAQKDFCHMMNPRPVAAGDFKEIFNNAMQQT